jgi:hypothetical protein
MQQLPSAAAMHVLMRQALTDPAMKAALRGAAAAAAAAVMMMMVPTTAAGVQLALVTLQWH